MIYNTHIIAQLYGKTDRIDFAEQFKTRTKKFVVDNIKFFRTLPKTEEAKIIGKQLLRSSSSVGANYRAACRSRSQAEFHSKFSIVVEEADESAFWMEVLVEAEIVKTPELTNLYDEANQILKIVSASRKTVSQNKISEEFILLIYKSGKSVIRKNQ